LVHGSLATGADEWQMQRPLAGVGYRLTVLDRRGYGGSSAPAEDFLVDADDIADLMGDGAHLVGHSYGGLGVMLAAAKRPEATWSLTVLEPAVVQAAASDPAWQALTAEIRAMWDADVPARDWVVRFLSAVGSDPDHLPNELVDAAADLAPVFRDGRPYFECDVPFAELAAARFPKLVVAGGHHRGLDAMCRDLATRIGADLAVVTGAGHEVQFVGAPLNDLLVDLWSRSWP
jgi:pimeloyl-ACP methyl ester carboxylesterase